MKQTLSLALMFLLANQVLAADLMWIWKSKRAKTEKVDFKKTFQLKKVPNKAPLKASCDNKMTLIINGNRVSRALSWNIPMQLDAAQYLKEGENTLIVKASNEGETGGLLLDLKIGEQQITTDKSWQFKGNKGKWQPAVELKKYGAAPWGQVFHSKMAQVPTTTPIKTLPGFKVEKLYDVPNKKQGSWVGMTHDHKGRLITCDQYGGLYRITLGTKPLAIEKLDVKVSGAHGVLYAFNSLYVFAYDSGLYRLHDTNKDDQYDKEEFLIPFKSKGGEHGVHSIVLTPDKKSLYLVIGNNADLPESVAQMRMKRAWGEDHLLTRMADGRGHNRGRLAPGGLVIKISPDAKHQELIAHGFRNQFDGAFNDQGEFFVYDADMEYDIGSPWYRPTRVNHVVSGADFGWRHGTGKWPGYYTDTLPTTLDIGPGSPTGVTNGLGAKFPAKYQKAIFINDWTYGTMYAVHLEQEGATYKATREEFISGKPLPLTDVMIHPDGNMYFMVGGRRTTSALYKLTYVGNESTAPVNAQPMAAEMKLKNKLEQLHLNDVGPKAIAEAWPQLGHSDRYVRHAARVAIEKQSASVWYSKLQLENNAWAIIEGAAALARVGDKTHQDLILSKLNGLNYASLPQDQFLAAMRSYQLAFTRLGKPAPASAASVIKTLDTFFPTQDNFKNRELAQVLLFLKAPNAIARTIQEMLNATEVQKKIMDDAILQRNDRYKSASLRMEMYRPNVQQFAMAFALHDIKEGWTKADYASYFSWFPRAKSWQGGNSFAIFIENCRKAVLATVLDPSLKKKYDELSTKSLLPPRAIDPPKGPGRLWIVTDAVKAVEHNLKGRNFKSGENLYHATACASCHRFAGFGSGIGPDLTGAANRYSLKDMMDNIIEPSKVISDQYGSTQFIMKDGSEIVGRIGTEENGIVHLMTNPFSPDSNFDVKLSEVKEQKEWPVSPMPQGLINSLNTDELSDLIAYIFSAGDENHKYFKSTKKTVQLDGGVKLFNGKDLKGWKGNPELWKVKDGIIYGSTHQRKIKANSFLVWEGEVEDFHLVYEAKSVGVNSGMMYRSKWKDESIYRLMGYQADMHPKPEYMAMLYGEQLGKRGIIAKRGQKVNVGMDGKAKVVGKTSDITPVDLGDWQTYEIICKSNRLIHKLNGEVTVDITDNHPDKLLKGMIGMQLHVGGPMECWFRNIQLKTL